MKDRLHVVLTGSNRGLGLEFTKRYLGAGHHVLATCRRPEDAEELRALADAHGERAIVGRCDVADAASCDAIADLVPWPRVDLLLHNAGVYGGPEDTIEDVDGDVAERTFRINAVGPLRITRSLWNRLDRGSRVAHVTSKMGSIADNTSGGRYSYRMSKAALNMAVRCLGHDCAPRGIVPFAIHPGWVRTDMGGRGAPLSIEDAVGAMVATIASRGPEHAGAFFDKDGNELPW